MKIIQAMKQVKDLNRKADDLVAKIKVHCADLDFETPMYENQSEVVAGWLQAHGDIVKEIERLRLAIQLTNLQTPVTIELGGKQITKSIAAWIHRRRDLAKMQEAAFKVLTDRGLKEGTVTNSQGATIEVHIRRYFNPGNRDSMIELYRSEPSIIDATLEVTNAVTDLIEN